MRMQSQEVSDAVMPNENGENANENTREVPTIQCFSSKQKYKDLKSRLKYLLYEHTCFESEMSRAQEKLMQLSSEKMVLLDQLLQYEPVSDDEEEATDYSSSEEETAEKKFRAAQLKEHSEDISRNLLSTKANVSSGVTLSTSSTKAGKSDDLAGKHGPGRSGTVPDYTEATSSTSSPAPATSAVGASSSTTTPSKGATKAGVKRQAKAASSKSSGGSAAKISKTVSRVRQTNAHQQDGGVPNAVSKLVVSYPINSISTEIPPSSTCILTTHTLSSSSSAPAPHLLPVSHKSVHPSSKPAQSSPHVSTVGGVHITTISTAAASSATVPPLIPAEAITKKGGRGRQRAGSSTSTSSSSSSSSGSESRDSGSDSSSSTDDEEERAPGGSGPVRLVSTVKTSSDLPRPKAILSPVKLTPPMLLKMPTSSSPPLVSPAALVSPLQNQTQAAFTNWTQSPHAMEDNNSPSSSSADPVVGFLPLAPPLSSPSSSLPFSSLSKPGSGNSAFQVFSPKHQQSAPQDVLSSPPLTAPGGQLSPPPVSCTVTSTNRQSVVPNNITSHS